MTDPTRPPTVPGADGGDVAIIGMACIFPGAPDVETYWRNIVSGVDAVTDPPAGRWDADIFLDPQSTSPDRIYCKRGGYLGDLARCEPAQYGLMPIIMRAGEPDQILALRVAHEALADSGYATQPFNRERTEVILGRGNYTSPGFVNLHMHTVVLEQTLEAVKNLLPDSSPEALDAIRRELKASLPPLGPDTAGVVIPNLTTGRVANRLDLMGANFTVDAACASALIAVDLAVRDLRTGRCDLALVGGVHLATHVPFLTVFNQLGALSRGSQIRPFDEKADGLVAGEGVGMIVLKRRVDAERAGDRIYAVIKAIGTASDGRGQGLLAPRVEGEELAMRRAYEAAGFAPDTVELIEAHGTATPVGDHCEIEALRRVFGLRRGALRSCAVGSVKSMIGHLMPAAGIAGLIKAALAVYHRVLPPTLHCETPNPKFELEKTALYINTETRPWVHGDRTPRRAGINAFGFGGINAHVILEEPGSDAAEEPGGGVPWETEVCLLQAASRQALIERARWLQRFLAARPEVALADLANSLNDDLRSSTVRLAVVASSVAELQIKLTRAVSRLEDDACRQIKDASGVYFFAEPLLARGKLAFLFPGEASQYPNMLRDLCLHFPKIRAVFDRADRVFLDQARPLRPSQSIYPLPSMGAEERTTVERRLWEMGGALEAILTANWGLYHLLRDLEVRPDVLLGHSSGEYSALAAAGIFTPDDTFMDRLVALSASNERRAAAGELPEAVLVAVGADRASVQPVLRDLGEDVFLAMDNCPHQVVLVGRPPAMERALETLRARGIVCQRLPFDRAYHTPLFQAASEPIRDMLNEARLAPPETEIFCAATTRPYPTTPAELRSVIAELLTRPVEFRGAVEALYAAGTRVFVEVGARGNLTAFVEDILRGRSHLAVPCDVPRRNGLTQLNHVVGLLAAQGASMRLDALYARRALRRLALDEGPAGHGEGPSGPRELPVSLDLPRMHLRPRPADARPAQAHVRNGKPVSETAAHAAQPTITPEIGVDAGVSVAHQVAAAAHTTHPALPEPAMAGPSALIVEEHFRTMERFLLVEQEVMEAFLGAVESRTATPSWSLLGAVVSLDPGRQVVVRRVIDPAEDLFLEDHALGGQEISETDAALRPVPMVPFTVCVEMMAAVATLLAPGQILRGMRQVQVRRWIVVAHPITVELTAHRSSEGDVKVEVRHLGATAVIADGTAIFAPSRAEPAAAAPLALVDDRPCRHRAAQLYAERIMFHGPRFRGVVSLDRSGQNGLGARLKVLPRTDLLASTTAPRFLTDPMLLDAAGQLLGYWAAERLEAGSSVFPFRLGTLEIYGDLPAVGESIRCELEVHEVTTRQVRVTLSLFGADEGLRARMADWEVWRFYPPRELHEFIRFPKLNLLSRSWPLAVAKLAPAGEFVCQRIDSTSETLSAVPGIVPHLLLSGAERRQWEALTGPETRRVEWVFGRAVAKDAVRILLKMRDGRDRFPTDLEIDHDGLGRPAVRFRGEDQPPDMPALSIAHREGVAVAIAGFRPDGRLGVDVERIHPRDEGFLRIAFDEEERRLLAAVGAAGRDEWVARLWCAKEAVAKAVGQGLVEGPRSVVARAVDSIGGSITVLLSGTLRRQFPELTGVGVIAQTHREGDWVVATSVCERSRAQ